MMADSKDSYDKGIELFNKKNYSEAKAYLEKVVPQDIENYENAQSKLIECMNALVAHYLSQGKDLLEKSFYLKASNTLDEGLKLYPENTELQKLKNDANTLATTLEKYEGPIYHVFFHSLIIYPQLCFKGDFMEQGYNYWMTTVKEFNLMIDEMYNRGYTLVDLKDLYSLDSSGKVIQNDIMLPKGKKALVISVDDMSYYKYMEKYGFAKKLVFDDNGNVATLVKTPEGNEIITRDGDIVPLLDDFVKENPDFSYKGAKATLALTGYEGILGYRTLQDDKKYPNWKEERVNVQPIVDKLKATGWSFANHSFTHTTKYTQKTITMGYLEYDMNRWLKEVGSILGPTNLYISPFGAYFGQKDPRHQYIVSKGFYVYCGVGDRPSQNIYSNNVYMSRINLDGYKMHFSPQVLKDFFDVKKVYDPARPPMK